MLSLFFLTTTQSLSKSDSSYWGLRQEAKTDLIGKISN